MRSGLGAPAGGEQERTALLGMVHTFTEAAFGTALLVDRHRSPAEQAARGGRGIDGRDIVDALTFHTMHPEGCGADMEKLLPRLMGAAELGDSGPDVDAEVLAAVSANIRFAQWAADTGREELYAAKLSEVVCCGVDPGLFMEGTLQLETFDGALLAAAAGEPDGGESGGPDGGEASSDDIGAEGIPEREATTESGPCTCELCSSIAQCAAGFADWVPTGVVQGLGAATVAKLAGYVAEE